MLKANLKKRVEDFTEAKQRLQGKTRIEYDGATFSGGCITLVIGLMLGLSFISRLVVIYSTNEHAFDVRETFYTNN